MPIANWSADEVWEYLMTAPTPWQGSNRELFDLYKGSNAGGTEIDKTYYSFLKDYISHTIMLEYIGTEGASNIEEGYFWKTTETA